ncbi:hypothetical protein AVEN_12028-1, partial [Araneus ventricosus]
RHTRRCSSSVESGSNLEPYDPEAETLPLRRVTIRPDFFLIGRIFKMSGFMPVKAAREKSVCNRIKSDASERTDANDRKFIASNVDEKADEPCDIRNE